MITNRAICFFRIIYTPQLSSALYKHMAPPSLDKILSNVIEKCQIRIMIMITMTMPTKIPFSISLFKFRYLIKLPMPQRAGFLCILPSNRKP